MLSHTISITLFAIIMPRFSYEYGDRIDVIERYEIVSHSVQRSPEASPECILSVQMTVDTSSDSVSGEQLRKTGRCEFVICGSRLREAS